MLPWIVLLRAACGLFVAAGWDCEKSAQVWAAYADLR
eukprot:SAG31_NODE_6816_length_1879_cov_1.997753_1_plen_36_part_10